MEQINCIDLIEFKKSIITQLKKTGCNSFAADLKQGFDKPCFFVQIIPKLKNLGSYTEENIVVFINYFPSTHTSLENFKMANKLRSIFINKLIVNERIFTVEEVNIDENESILNFSFLIKNIEMITYDDTDEMKMEKLAIKL